MCACVRACEEHNKTTICYETAILLFKIVDPDLMAPTVTRDVANVRLTTIVIQLLVNVLMDVNFGGRVTNAKHI